MASTSTMRRMHYADIIRQKMRTTDNPFKRPLMIRELARHMGYSYEHLRKVVNGDPVASAEFNEALCQALGLDPNKMWELARYEKVTRKFKTIPMSLPSVPPDARFVDLWPRLSDDQKVKLLRIAEAYADEQEVENARLNSFLTRQQSPQHEDAVTPVATV